MKIGGLKWVNGRIVQLSYLIDFKRSAHVSKGSRAGDARALAGSVGAFQQRASRNCKRGGRGLLAFLEFVTTCL